MRAGVVERFHTGWRNVCPPRTGDNSAQHQWSSTEHVVQLIPSVTIICGNSVASNQSTCHLTPPFWSGFLLLGWHPAVQSGSNPFRRRRYAAHAGPFGINSATPAFGTWPARFYVLRTKAGTGGHGEVSPDHSVSRALVKRIRSLRVIVAPLASWGASFGSVTRGSRYSPRNRAISGLG